MPPTLIFPNTYHGLLEETLQNTNQGNTTSKCSERDLFSFRWHWWCCHDPIRTCWTTWQLRLNWNMDYNRPSAWRSCDALFFCWKELKSPPEVGRFWYIYIFGCYLEYLDFYQCWKLSEFCWKAILLPVLKTTKRPKDLWWGFTDYPAAGLASFPTKKRLPSVFGFWHSVTDFRTRLFSRFFVEKLVWMKIWMVRVSIQHLSRRFLIARTTRTTALLCRRCHVSRTCVWWEFVVIDSTCAIR